MFRSGDSACAALMRELDWAATPLGPPDGWPQPLKTLVEMMLAANQPMFVAWGPERTLLYNDPYIALLGRKHPEAMGRPFMEVWREAAADLEPLYARVWAGEPVHMDDITLFLDRAGRGPEEAHFAFSYTPVRDSDGAVTGLFCACVETTEQVRSAAELKASEERTALALQAARLGTFDWNLRTNAVQLDARSREIFGFTANEPVHSDDVFARVHPDDIGRVRALVDRASERRQSSEIKYRVRLPDGGQRIVCSFADPVIGPDGDLLAMVGVFEDVTAVRENEARVREAESDYRYALDLSPQTIWSSGPDGLLDRVGQRWTEWTGSSGLGTSWGDVLHPDDLQPSIDAWTRSITTGAPYDIWHRARMAADGSYHWMHSRAYARRDEAGNIVRWYGTTEDVDAVKRAEDAQRESEERLRLVVDNATDYAIFTMDPERRVTSWSAGAAAIFGWTADEMIGGPADRLFTPDDLERRQPEVEVGEALATGCANDQRWHVRKDGTRVFMNGSVRPLPPGPDGAPAGVMKIARDETEARRAADALAESESRFRNMADHAPVMMWVTDATGNCTYLNKRWYDFTGQTAEEAEGFGWLGATHPDDKAAAEAVFVEANAARAPFKTDYRLRRKDGAYRWAIDAASPRFDADGTYLGYVGSVIDIDERREVEDALRASEEFNRRVLASSADCIKVLDLESRLEFMSEGGMCLLELDEFDAVRGTYWPDFWSGEEREKALSAIDTAKRGGTGRFQGFAATMKGSPRWWDVSVTAIDGPDGKPEKLLSVSRDITEQRAAQQALEDLNTTLEQRVATTVAEREAANALYRAYFHHSAEALFVIDVDADGRFLVEELNPAHEAATGFSTAEHRGRDLRELFPPDLYEQIVGHYRRALETGEVQHYQDQFTIGGGATRHWDTVLVPIRDADGRVVRLIGSSRDKTAQVLAEEALRQAQKMEAVGQLTGGIAHDFNNLLTGIVGSLELLQRRLAEGRYETLERYASVAMTSSQRAAALTQRLLAFSRRQPLSPKTVDANRLVASMEDLLRRTLGPQIDLEMVLAGGLWPTLCDPNQLESAILNLAINARDAMPDGGRLTVETANAHLDDAYARARAGEVEPGQYVAICVTDTGTGIAPEAMARIFEPFFTTKPLGQGTGLGLSQLYGFVKQSGGHVAVYSEPGAGTTFKLYLPRHGGRMDAAEVQAGAPEPLRAGGGQSVLVVEDEAGVRMLIAETLDELGYGAIEAVDGPGGLKELQSDRRIDLLVTDVGLPGLNGRQLADAAREIRPGLKVLFITGFAGNAAVGNGLLEPGMEMMTKPFAMDALAAKISGMIEG